LDEKKVPEVKWKLSFISLVAGSMKLEAAIAHFGIGIVTTYKWIRRWNDESVGG
jgi:transposase